MVNEGKSEGRCGTQKSGSKNVQRLSIFGNGRHCLAFASKNGQLVGSAGLAVSEEH